MSHFGVAPSRDMRPILSICVPTFNRATCLQNLLLNLAKIKNEHTAAVEICISNNQSTDGTEHVIEEWRGKLGLKVATQSKNIGATLNAIAVAKAATGKWLMIVGDDDQLKPDNFAMLLELLQGADEADWILVGVADHSGKESLLGDLRPGRFEAGVFRRTVLRTGLYRFGFVGMHVFPAILQPVFAGLSLAQVQSWPHLALLLRHLQGGHIQVFSAPVVEQAGGGGALFWRMGDWVQISLRKLNIIAEARMVIKDPRWFFDVLVLRELYSLRNAKNLVLWKAIDPEDFCRRAFHEHVVRYSLLGPFSFCAAVHGIFLLGIYATPSSAMRLMLRLLGKQNIVATHIDQLRSKAGFDGVQRGL